MKMKKEGRGYCGEEEEEWKEGGWINGVRQRSAAASSFPQSVFLQAGLFWSRLHSLF